MTIARLRARSGRLVGNAHIVEVLDPDSVVPYKSTAVCGFKPKRYWQPANQHDATCPACLAICKETM